MNVAEQAAPGVPVREGAYGTKIAAVEPGGVEVIPLSERHGRPLQMFWTWTSPNLQFATVFVGVLAVAAYGLTFWLAVLAIVLGNALGSLMHGILSAQGPRYGVTQMVLSRLPFGYSGNILPAGLNILTSVGWFAVGSISAALAVNTLTGLSLPLCLLIIVLVQVVVAFFGHNMIHVVARYAFPVLAVVFAVCSMFILSRADFTAHSGGEIGGFLLAFASCWSFAAAWSPTASDYTRYLSPEINRRMVGLWAGFGVFLSCTVLQIVGAASATIGSRALGDPTGAFVGHLPQPVAVITLIAIALGAVLAGVMNMYSGAISFAALDLPLPSRFRRAVSALLFGVVGLVVAYVGLASAGERYEAFLLVIAYWVGPWLGTVLADLYLRGGQPDLQVERLLFDRRRRNRAGLISMAAGLLVSVWLFSNQQLFVGVISRQWSSIGDITPEVGFTISAVCYVMWQKVARVRRAGR